MVSQFDELIFKVLILGDGSVGKSSFLLRYIEDTFTGNSMSTVGVDYKIKLVQSTQDSLNIKLQIWDTAGQERFRSITKNYFKGSDGIMLIYDITNQPSFNSIKNWINQIKEYLEEEACITLVGNKIDLDSARKVSSQDGNKISNEFHFSFFEASAKENINVCEAFNNLTKEMVKRYKIKEDNKKFELSNSDTKNISKKKGC
jgi:small GTP-binding protein